jgi:NDMA-dependent alcohol dehydrogenase
VKVRAAVLGDLKQPWKTEVIDIDEPNDWEVEIKMAYAGLCHSDQHLQDGTLTASQETLDSMGIESLFPMLGGHEGAGVITKVGAKVPGLAVGDHVATSFIPACGKCHWCATGRQNLCDAGAWTLAGPSISDHTYRYSLDGTPLNRMAQLGTFAEYAVLDHRSVVKIDPDDSLRAAALISCGLATGFGSAVTRGGVRPGETVVIVGCGGVGSGALQGARIAGARTIVAVDPVASKRDNARTLGATHTAASIVDAMPLVSELTRGRMADVAVLTPSVLHSNIVGEAVHIVGKAGRVVCTAAAPSQQTSVDLDLGSFIMWNKSLLGSVFGSNSPGAFIPELLALYKSGQLRIDELITREYALDEVQSGYEDLLAGANIRGVIAFD